MVVDYEKMNAAVSDYVRDVAGVFPVSKAVLYGSYAKGTANKHSDVDICFFIDDELDASKRIDVLTRLLGLTHKYSSLDTLCIEPNVFPTSEIERGNPFVNEVLATGREIPI